MINVMVTSLCCSNEVAALCVREGGREEGGREEGGREGGREGWASCTAFSSVYTSLLCVGFVFVCTHLAFSVCMGASCVCTRVYVCVHVCVLARICHVCMFETYMYGRAYVSFLSSPSFLPLFLPLLPPPFPPPPSSPFSSPSSLPLLLPPSPGPKLVLEESYISFGNLECGKVGSGVLHIRNDSSVPAIFQVM